jgi:hypothetical protein
MIQAKHPMYAKYKNKPVVFELCPHVLGYIGESDPETDQFERVLCYQLDGPDPNPHWKCFDLIELELQNPPPPTSHWETPSNYSDWQNSVKNVKHYVPF